MEILKRITFFLSMIIVFIPIMLITFFISIPIWLFTGKDILNYVCDNLLIELVKIL